MNIAQHPSKQGRRRQRQHRAHPQGLFDDGVEVVEAGHAGEPTFPISREVEQRIVAGNLAAALVQDAIDADPTHGPLGIAHTRWATHGAPAVHNAHPHFSHGTGKEAGGKPGRIALVHNGIIENHDELRAALRAKGYEFASQTDTEVICHLIDSLYDGDLFEAVQAAVGTGRSRDRNTASLVFLLLRLVEDETQTMVAHVVKVADFGLAKSYKQTGMSGVTMVGDVAGTIAYMPPEQVRDFKDVQPPSDIYAAGMTAYSLLTDLVADQQTFTGMWTGGTLDV